MSYPPDSPQPVPPPAGGPWSHPPVPPPNAGPQPGWAPHPQMPPTVVVNQLPPKKSRTGLVIGIVVAAVLTFCLCGGLLAAVGGDDTSRGDATGAAATDKAVADETPEDAAAEPDDEPKAAKIGQPVRDGKFEFVVKKVKCGVKNVGGTYGETAQGQFCLITLTIENIGDKAQMFNDFDQRAYDAADREYESNSQAGWFANEDTNVWLNDINPGNKVTGVLVFDIPKKSKLTRLELHDSSFSGGVEVTL